MIDMPRGACIKQPFVIRPPFGIAAGLGDGRQAELLRSLKQEAEASLGSMMMGLLVESARDTLTSMNRPEGDCIFCMSSLSEEPGTSGRSDTDILKLPCYHCFHL
jgi:hypothetical protein